ncbi:unnamed protein product, partial [Pleuronectes platessa]
FPCDYATHIQCWTDWFDRDDPSGTGDWEVFSLLRIENPGKICLKPIQIEAKTLTGLSAAAAGDVIFKSDTASGFVCRNKDQKITKMCNDYHIRFSCHSPFCTSGAPGVCWTNWYDRDLPSGTGDWERLSDLKTENPGEICDSPTYIEAVTTDTLTPAISTGENFYQQSAPVRPFFRQRGRRGKAVSGNGCFQSSLKACLRRARLGETEPEIESSIRKEIPSIMPLIPRGEIHFCMTFLLCLCPAGILSSSVVLKPGGRTPLRPQPLQGRALR